MHDQCGQCEFSDRRWWVAQPCGAGHARCECPSDRSELRTSGDAAKRNIELRTDGIARAQSRQPHRDHQLPGAARDGGSYSEFVGAGQVDVAAADAGAGAWDGVYATPNALNAIADTRNPTQSHF